MLWGLLCDILKNSYEEDYYDCVISLMSVYVGGYILGVIFN